MKKRYHIDDNVTESMNNNDDISRIEEHALDTMEAGTDVEECPDADVLQVCQDLHDMTLCLRNSRDDVDVEDDLRLFHERHHRLKSSKRYNLRRYGWAAAIVLLLLMIGTYTYFNKVSDRKLAETVVSKQPQTEVTLNVDNKKTVTLATPTFEKLSRKEDDDRYTEMTLDVSKLEMERATITIPDGKTYRVVLADGSEAYLSPGSRLVFTSAPINGKRIVVLEGEAFFKVVHDEKHPFVVQTPECNVSVLGTEFNVACYAGEAPTVTLVKGGVCVKDREGKHEALLTPGKQARLVSEGFDVAAANTEVYAYRLQGFLYFDDVTLGEMMERIGHWFGVKVVFDASIKRDIKVHFMAELNEGFSVVLRRLNSLDGVRFTLKDATLHVESE